MKNPFIWNGTKIEINKENIKSKIKYKGCIYCNISLNGYNIWCQIKKVKTHLPCIFDEIKEYFGLNKTGTHWLSINGCNYIIYRIPNDKKKPIYENILTDFSNNLQNEYINQIRNIYAYRELLGIYKSNDKCIKIRFENKKEPWRLPYFISYYENNISGDLEISVIPLSVRKKWFNNITLEETILKLLKIKDIKNIGDFTNNFRIFLKKQIERIDKDLINWVSIIIDRIQRKILISLPE